MIFALNYLKIRELVPPKLSCHLRICVNFESHSLTGIIKFSEAKISILSL